jgi:hypothetical protein
MTLIEGFLYSLLTTADEENGTAETPNIVGPNQIKIF